MARSLLEIHEEFIEAKDKEAYWKRLILENGRTPSEGYGFLRACAHAARFQPDQLEHYLQEPNKSEVLQYALALDDPTVHSAMLAHLRCASAATNADGLRICSFLKQEVGKNEYNGSLCSSYLRDLLWIFLAARDAKAEDLDDPSFWRRQVPPTERAEVRVLLAVPGGNRGYVGTLSLELVERGKGITAEAHDLTLYPTPLLSLLTRDKSFKKAEQAALSYAESVFGKSLPNNVDIRWDLGLSQGGVLPPGLEGDSLGAAIALALLQLLGYQQLQPLEKKLAWAAASASVDSEGNLSTVGEVFSKLIAADRRMSGVNVVVVAAGQPVQDYPDFKPDPVDERILRRITATDLESPQGAEFCLIRAKSILQAVDLLVLYEKTRRGPPPPDYGLTQGTPRAHLGTDWPTALRTFDLGMVWGLDRGGFIGLASGAKTDGLYDALLYSERALWDALGRRNTPRPHSLHEQIPVRYWVRITRPDRYANGPQSIRELWDSAEPSDSLQLRYLRQLARAPESLGVLLEVDAAIVENVHTAVQWCHQLLQGIFPVRPIAIVIHIAGGTPDQHDNHLRALQAQFRDTAGANPDLNYPIQSIAWIGAPSVRHHQSDPRKRSVLAWARELVVEPMASGRALWTSLYLLLDAIKTRVGAIGSYACLVPPFEGITKRLNITTEPPMTPPFPDLKTLVDEIDEFSSPSIGAPFAWTDDVDRQFLSAVRDFFPELLPALIREYAAGKRRAGWRQSLLLAAPSDHLMDAWVQGSALASNRITDDMLLPCKGVRVVNALALGILRTCRTAQGGHTLSFEPERAYQVLRQLCPTLSVELKSLVEHALAHGNLVLPPKEIEQLCVDCGESIRLLAFRGGISNELPPGFLVKQARTLNDSSFWYYIARLMPTPELVRELLGAPEVFAGVPARAIIGLMGTEEWHDILNRKDRQLLEGLVECRGGRPLSTFVRNTATSP